MLRPATSAPNVLGTDSIPSPAPSRHSTCNPWFRARHVQCPALLQRPRVGRLRGCSWFLDPPGQRRPAHHESGAASRHPLEAYQPTPVPRRMMHAGQSINCSPASFHGLVLLAQADRGLFLGNGTRVLLRYPKVLACCPLAVSRQRRRQPPPAYKLTYPREGQKRCEPAVNRLRQSSCTRRIRITAYSLSVPRATCPISSFHVPNV